jgi:hypothetical protein
MEKGLILARPVSRQVPHHSTTPLLHYSISLQSIRSEAEDVRKRFDAVIVMARHD